jgi:hypothetical protein
MAIAKTCFTDDALRRNLPEFEKYMPKEEPKEEKQLPMVTTLIADLTKLGWPAGAKTA